MSSARSALGHPTPGVSVSARAFAARARYGSLLPLVGLAAALAVWGILAGPWAPPLARAFAPDRAFAALARLFATGTIEPHLVSSVLRIAAGILVAAAVGIPAGILLARSRAADRVAAGVLPLLRMISPLTWMPVAVMAFGIGDRPVVFLVAAAAVWPLLLSTAHGVATADPRWIGAARTLGAGRRQLVRRVLIPAALPDVLTGLRLSLGVAWIVLVPAEMLGVRSGLGYFVLDTRDRFAYDELAALVLLIGAVGFVLDAGVRALHARFAWTAQ
ncbi:MAG: ABC transporter permease [Chloroflexi bacterium]|nr:ABC transporter permease [Chloroflexota bacterium]